jgi:site-specific recombinase XerD
MKGKTGTVAEAPVRYLKADELNRLLAAAKRRGLRDHLLLALSYRLGLRVGEATGLKFGDVVAKDSRHGEVLVRGLKRGLVRSYSIPRDLLPLVRRWMKERGHGPGAFFTGRQGESLTRQRCWQIVKACAKDAGLPADVRFHTLRHSIGVHAINGGMTTEDVKDLLRHRSIRSTEIYAVTSPERRRGYLRRLDESGDVVKVRP